MSRVMTQRLFYTVLTMIIFLFTIFKSAMTSDGFELYNITIGSVILGTFLSIVSSGIIWGGMRFFNIKRTGYSHLYMGKFGFTLVAILFLIFGVISGLNFYYEDYYPIHYSETKINEYMNDKNFTELKQLSKGSTRVYEYLKRGSSMHITQKAYTDATNVIYFSEINGIDSPATSIFLSKERQGISGIRVKYKLAQIYIDQ